MVLMVLLFTIANAHAHGGVDIFLESIYPEPQNSDHSTPIVYEDLEAVMNYTFLPETNCYTVCSDGSQYAEEVLKTFYIAKGALQVVNGPLHEVSNCTGFIVLATDQMSLKSVVGRMRRYAKHRILCVIESGDMSSLERFLKKNEYLFGEAEVALFFKKDLNSGLQIRQPLIRDLKKISLKNEAAWEKQNLRHRDFRGRNIVVSTSNCSIFVRVGEIERDGTTRLFSGIEATILNEVTKRLNLTYKFTPIASERTADELTNGSWSGGVLEAVASGHADVGFCGLWSQHQKFFAGRLEASHTIQSMCITYLVPRPPLMNASWKIVLTPFDNHLWMILTGTMIGFSGFIKWASTSSRKFLGDRSSEYESLEYNMLIVFGILSATSWPKFRQLLSPLKHLISWWILFSILLNTCYSTTLISNLYTLKYTKKPTTIGDLVDDGYLWRTEMRFPGETLWDVSKRKYNKWMSRQRILPPNASYVPSSDDSYTKQAVIGAVIGQYFVPLAVRSLPEEYFTNYEVMDNCVASVFEAYFFRPGSPLITDFNARLREMVEAGIMDHYRHQIPLFSGNFPTKPLDKYQIIESGVHSIGFSHISGIFGILGYGYLISLCVLVIEVLYSRLTTSLVKVERDMKG